MLITLESKNFGSFTKLAKCICLAKTQLVPLSTATSISSQVQILCFGLDNIEVESFEGSRVILPVLQQFTRSFVAPLIRNMGLEIEVIQYLISSSSILILTIVDCY